MLHLVTRFFEPQKAVMQAYALYAHINEASRKSEFFTDWHVPDTLDGRFELILLHMFIYLHSMKALGSGTTDQQRRLIEAFFDDMDRSVREIGVTDTGVGKRIKNMANAFYGRINAFETSLHDDQALQDAIYTNLYGTVDEPPASVDMVVEYIHRELATLKGKPIHTAAFLDAQLSA